MDQIKYANNYFKKDKRKEKREEAIDYFKKDKREDTSLKDHQEAEASLIICSENPRTVYELIATLTSIESEMGNYELIYQEDQTIFDLYFDKDLVLDKKRLDIPHSSFNTAA